MSVRFIRSHDLLRIILENDVTLQDLFNGVDEIYRDTIPKLVLWDTSNSFEPNTEDAAEQLKQLSAYAVEKGKNRSDSRVALLSPANAHFGLGRVSTALAENNNAAYNMAVFRDEETAMAWLYDGP